MEQSNSDMYGHGKPVETKSNKTQSNKDKNKTDDVTRFKHSEVDELFNLVKTDKGIIICVGNNKISRKSFKTWKAAENYIASKPYEILINVSVLIQKMNYENEANSAKSAKDAQNGK